MGLHYYEIFSEEVKTYTQQRWPNNSLILISYQAEIIYKIKLNQKVNAFITQETNSYLYCFLKVMFTLDTISLTYVPAAAFSMTSCLLFNVVNAVTVTQARLMVPEPPESPTNFRKAFHVSVTGRDSAGVSVDSRLRRS